MVQRPRVMVASGVLAACLVFGLTGCSDSQPPDSAFTGPSAAPPGASEQPEVPAAPAAKGKKGKDPFADMGMREKREWRRQQAAKAAGGQAP